MSDMPYGPPRTMLHALARDWWLILLRGIVTVPFGVLAFMWPDITFVVVFGLFGLFALIDGGFWLVLAVMCPIAFGRLLLAAVGLVSIAIALLIMNDSHGPMMMIILLRLLGLWVIAVGAFHIVSAIRMRKEGHTDWWVIVVGALATLSGIVMLVSWRIEAIAVGYVAGVYVTFCGVWWIIFALRLRRHRLWPPIGDGVRANRGERPA